MNDLSKLLRVIPIVLIGIIGLTASGCEQLTAPVSKPCSVVVANPSIYTVTVLFDGQTYWDNNNSPSQIWIKADLEDGSEHVIVVYTKDPRIFYQKYTVRVVAGKKFPYGDYTGNAIVRIGGSVSDATRN